ncbi:hypothetical protein ABH924_004630 [Arthrobacter sp. GAS37]|uniref:hypothetical protein n=1 Tax=Arthrobacter sp. GAS37 TaxID=3156261 RepID=UPI0038342C82
MNIQDLEARATQRLDAERTAKVESITALAGAAERVVTVRTELADAEKNHTAAYSKALRLGWTDADLKEFGIEQPGKKPSGRPRSQRKPATKTAPDAHQGGDE